MDSSVYTYKEYAEKYKISRLVDIKKKASESHKVLNRLAVLFQERQKIIQALYPVGEQYRTNIKSNIISFFENGTVEEYFEAGQDEKDRKDLIDSWEDQYGRFLYNKGNFRESIKKSQGLLPEELFEAFREIDAEDVKMLPSQAVPGIVLGMLHLKDAIEEEIEEVINDNHVSREELELIEARFSGQLPWMGSVREMALLMQMLLLSQKIETPGSSSISKVACIYPHFRVKGKADGSQYSERTLKDALNKTLGDAQMSYARLRELLKK